MATNESSGTRPCRICARIEEIRAGEVAELVADLENSYVVLGDSQFYRGYCIVFAKQHFTELHLMPRAQALALFEETILVGRAAYSVVKPLKLNYECLGNEVPHVHWHIFPRQLTDPEPRRPVWSRPDTLDKVELEPADKMGLIRSLQTEINRLAGQRPDGA
jgi:diadenosine tetraphosphate (Ap4A) HIT family hydrolase